MLKNYFKIAWRNLRKHATYTSINIIGLTIGLGCCLRIALYVQDELSYDKYHKNIDNIYRVLHGNAEDKREVRTVKILITIIRFGVTHLLVLHLKPTFRK